jgi:hypothetical protein
MLLVTTGVHVTTFISISQTNLSDKMGGGGYKTFTTHSLHPLLPQFSSVLHISIRSTKWNVVFKVLLVIPKFEFKARIF